MLPLSKKIEDQYLNIAFEETLELLEWQQLCEHLASFSQTIQGRRKCLNFSLPMTFEESYRQLGETVEMEDLDQENDELITFEGLHDLEDILLRCNKEGIVSGEELLQVSSTLRTARRLRRQIDNATLRPITSSLLKNVTTLPELEQLLECGLEDGGRVADRASEVLFQLRNKLKALRLEIKEILQELLKKNSAIVQENLIISRYGRFVLALKVGAIDQIPGIIHGSSSSGNTIFVEPKIVIKLANKIKLIEGQIGEEEARLLSTWSKEVGKNFVDLEHLCNVMLSLEFALSRARYSHWLGGIRPAISKDSNTPFILKDFRHPLLLWQEKYGHGKVVVPISFEVSSDLRVVAITGPNTGGKTVTLKGMGLAVLMARAGLFLPCSGEPCLPWFNQVLADIGDEQSLQQSLSTFSGHIMRIMRIFDAILNNPGPTLVLLDEVGAGTDPTEGAALAIALLRKFAEIVRLTIATTHLGELKALKYNDPRFENASVSFDIETITPTYHLQWGIPGRSNAIAIATRLGIDSEIIDEAHRLMSLKDVENVNDIIQALEKQRERQQRAAEDAAALLARTEVLHEELLSQWNKQREQSEQLQEYGRQKLESSIREGQKEVRKLIYRLRHQGASGETARTVGQHLRKMQNTYKPKSKSRDNLNWFPKVGDRVRLLSLGKAAEVLEISEDKSQVKVICGVFRSQVDIRQIESLDGKKTKLSQGDIQVSASLGKGNYSTVRTKQNTVDVRGLRVHEAESVLEETLRVTNGPVWVIHGIGSGKLKNGLRNWLKDLPYVEKIVDAEKSDGGPGCTVIWMR